MGVMGGVKTQLSKGANFLKTKLRSKTGELHETFASETILRQQEEITRLQEEIAAMIKYPPTPSGVPVLTEGDILFAYRGIIKETYLAVGMMDGTEEQLTPCFMNTYMHAIREVISYFHLLPASEYHHHNEVGGLLRHSLEVALMTLRMAKGSRPIPIGFQDEELLREPRWRFAAWLSGLLHDAGKIISDMRVHGKEIPSIWNPQIENIYDFSNRHGIRRYTVTWSPQRANHYHEKLSILLLDKVLSDVAKRWLYETTDNLSGPIIDALQSYMRKEGYIEKPLRRADALSSERDRRTQYHDLIGERKSGLGHSIIAGIRHLRKNQWNKVNEIGARVYVIDDEVYLDYRNGMQDIINHMNCSSKEAGQGARIDSDIGRVVTEMEELGIVEPMHEESDFVRLTFEGKQGKLRQVDIVRVSYPTLVFEGEILPPNLKKCEIEFSRAGEKLTIDEKGQLTYTEPKKNPYETLYNLDPDKGSQVNRNKTRNLNLPGFSKTAQEMDAPGTQKPAFGNKQIGQQIPAQISNNYAAGNSKVGAGGHPSVQPAIPNNASQQHQTSTNSGQSSTKPSGNKPATKPASQNSSQSKSKASQQKVRKPITFENEPEEQTASTPVARKEPSIWDGMNINADDEPPDVTDAPEHSTVWTGMEIDASQGESSHNLSSASSDIESSTARVPPEPSSEIKPQQKKSKKHTNSNANKSQSPSRLKALKDSEQKTLCYLVAWALSDGHCQSESLISYSSRPALYAQKNWIKEIAELKNNDFNADSIFDRFGDKLNSGKLLGVDADDYAKLSNDAVRAIAEMFGVSDKVLMEQTKNLNDYGRPERLDNLSFFQGKLQISNLQERLILDSNLAYELNLLKHGVVTNV